MSYSHRLRILAEADGQLISRFEERASGRTVVAPAVVHLRAGEVARTIPIGVPLPANASPVASYVLIATNRPGVRARLALAGTSLTCRASGNLVTGVESVLSHVQDGTVVPCFIDGGSWINNAVGSASGYKNLKWSSVVGGAVNYSGMSWYSNANGLTTIQGAYIFGRNNYVDLGAANDGKEFRLWILTPSKTNLTSVKLYLGSWPFGTDNNDDSALVISGTVNDTAMVNTTPPGYYWVADVTSQVANNRRNLIVANKSAFTAAGTGTPAPAWNRITSFRVEWVYSIAPGNVNCGGSAVYFGDPPNAVVNSAAILSAVVTDRSGLHLSLDAPADGDADVTILGSIS